MNGQALAGSKLGVFGKGGAGKSTVTALLAHRLHRLGYSVCVLDADSTNLGLERALGCEREPESLIAHLGGPVFEGGTVTCPVDDPTPLTSGQISVSSLPRQFVCSPASGLYVLRAGKMAGVAAGSGCDGPIAKIARDVRFKTDEAEPVTLVDFKAGFEDAARGVVAGMDWAVVVLDPTYASLEFAGHMRIMEAALRAGRLPATKHLDSAALVAVANRIFEQAALRGVLFVLNKVLDGGMRAALYGKLAAKGIVPSAVLFQTPSIAQAGLAGDALNPAPVGTEVDRIVTELERRAGASVMRPLTPS